MSAVTFDRQSSGEYGDAPVASTVAARDYKCASDLVVQCVTGDVTHTLKAEGFDASEDGTGRGQPIVPVLSVHGTQDPDTNVELAHTLGRNHGQENAITYPLLEVGKRTGTSTTDPRAGIGIGNDNDPMFTLQASAQHGVAYSVALRGREGGATAELGDDLAGCLRASSGGGDKPHALVKMAVRRLTPVECERLQGFPDNYTTIPWRGKSGGECPDGPRYKALGNSMAVPCMAFIGRRIALATGFIADNDNAPATSAVA